MKTNGHIASEDLLAVKVASLRRAQCFPHRPSTVEAIETHMSWVFIAGDRVYKMKKPVRIDGIDMTGLGHRLRNCREEVRLNRRLARDVYLGVVPLAQEEPSGDLRVNGSGRAVDWLVEMRYLARERMLDRALTQGTAGTAEIRSVADLLGRFYRDCEPAEVSEPAYGFHLREEIAGTESDLHELAEGRFATRSANLNGALRRFLDQHPGLLNSRVREGHIVEGHGDLRPEHIWLGPPPRIIDCLEFSRNLRILDPADELAFLGMGCEQLGHPCVEQILFSTYQNLSGDRPSSRLIHFYKAFRALIRARIALRHLRDSSAPTPEKWISQTESYLALAERAARYFAIGVC